MPSHHASLIMASAFVGVNFALPLLASKTRWRGKAFAILGVVDLLLLIAFFLLLPQHGTTDWRQESPENLPEGIMVAIIVVMLFLTYPPRWFRVSYENRRRWVVWSTGALFLIGIWGCCALFSPARHEARNKAALRNRELYRQHKLKGW